MYIYCTLSDAESIGYIYGASVSIGQETGRTLRLANEGTYLRVELEEKKADLKTNDAPIPSNDPLKSAELEIKASTGGAAVGQGQTGLVNVSLLKMKKKMKGARQD